MKLSENMRWSIFGVIAAGVLFFAWKSVDFDKPARKAAAIAEEQYSIDTHEKMLESRRNMGFVEKVNYTNAFGDVTNSVTNVLGRTKGTTLAITREGAGKLSSVCFSAITDSSKRELFAPHFSSVVYVKFDNGETKEFTANRGTSGTLCISSRTRFLFQVERASVMQVQLVFLDHYSKVPEVHEWNLSTFNEGRK